MYGISFSSQFIRRGNGNSLTFGRHPEGIPSSTPPMDVALRRYADLEIGNIINNGNRLRADHSFWNGPQINYISPQWGVNALAAAVIGQNAALITELINNPHINLNRLLPLQKAPARILQQLALPQKQALRNQLQRQGFYTVLDMFRILLASPIDTKWVEDFKFPTTIHKNRGFQKNREAIEILVEMLEDQGALSAAQVIPTLRPATE